jgi:tetratricopeptide (TPR) repeat protein
MGAFPMKARGTAIFVLVALTTLAGVPAQEPGQADRPDLADTRALDRIREDLVALRFEQALAAIETFLGEGSPTEPERLEALVLRSQAHVAIGKLQAAEQDYREILGLDPGHEPDPTLTPAKALERFRKVREGTVGTLVVLLEPADARLLVDEREVAPGSAGRVPLLAGEHLVRAERAGHDPLERSVVVEAGADVAAELRLVPNARTIVLETEPDGIEVRVDGTPIGTTVRPETGGPGRIVVENLALGEHVYEMSRPCFRTERRRDILTVDLLDRAPKTYEVVRLVPVRAALGLRGGPSGAEVFLDGEPAGRLPREPLEVCPGLHRVEVRHGGRAVWISREELAEAEDRRIEIVPRPSIVLLGAEQWPEGLAGLSRYSLLEARPSPPEADLSNAASWQAVDLPRDADLALAVVRSGGAETWYLYAPLLAAASRLENPGSLARPVWTGPSWGWFLADAEPGGPVIVIDAPAGGPAALAGLEAGDRLVSLGGFDVATAERARSVLALASPDSPLAVAWRTAADGSLRIADLRAVRTPLLDPGPFSDATRASVRAAWAVVDALCDPEQAAAALSNLALLLGDAGLGEQAIETWRRVRWHERAGIGQGTARYYLGRELQRAGRDGEAAEAYRAAAASAATVFDDAGPPVAPAARDRLAALGFESR